MSSKSYRYRRAILIVGLLGVSCSRYGVAAENDHVSFEREVLPLLEKRCNHCHNPEEAQGGLDLTRLETILRGGEQFGPAVVPGNAELSPLVKLVSGNSEPAMPEDGEALSNNEIEILSRWVAEGAHDDTPQFSDEQLRFFESNIRPVLFNKCFKCHAGDEPESGLRLTSRHGLILGGHRGPSVIIGKPAQSLLVAAIRHQGDLAMPRNGDRLSEQQVNDFEKWIRDGLAWPNHEKVLAREKRFTISDAERSHWAFQPLPFWPKQGWSIDTELALKHNELGLKSAQPAEPSRLLRRVAYDLTGYPPTQEQLDAFLSQPGDANYEHFVDEFLSSPQFGYRWGRHWLDYTRNGINGKPNRGPLFESDEYVDWVAKCLNEDRPWDWFTRVHIAGDKMPGYEKGGYSTEQAVAATIPLNGARTFERIEEDSFVLMDKLDEGVEFLGRSLMGISLECARCHDHKFDPISQKDYYALLGFFQSSWYGRVRHDTNSLADAEQQINRYRELIAQRARLNGKIRKFNIINSRGFSEWKKKRVPQLGPYDHRMLEIEITVLKAELKDAESRGDKRTARTTQKTLDERFKKLADFTPRYFDLRPFKLIGYFLRGHKTQVGLIERANTYGLTAEAAELQGLADFFEAENKEWRRRHRFGGLAVDDPRIEIPMTWQRELEAIDVELAKIDEDSLWVRCDGGLRRVEDLEPFKEMVDANKTVFRVETVPPYVGDARMLKRGDVREPAELVPRRFPVFFTDEVPEIEGSGRLALAKWVTEPGSIQSALVARTVVNRAWQNLFGEALCRTTKELGRLGEQPEMPELIDQLSTRFIQNGWSLKSLIKEIVLSDTYRRSSTADEELLSIDPHNRWFARQNVRRLEYEPIVNTMCWLARGRPAHPYQRDGYVGQTEYYNVYFDGPTNEDIVDHREASISSAQALFLMNDLQSVRHIARRFVERQARSFASLKHDKWANEVYRQLLQRDATNIELTEANAFLNHQISTEKQTDLKALEDFVHLVLCGNEILYLE
ncbi:PSD1 and planctomycete cytochrome C domain-containing protein [Calycomorphotria hydatis]|uniref:Planctomycete cytochrome C n=1 Tax=Calycomorphotria hydatis TaxID=2528027 RepID=A0A517TEB9_9PLAN|nr:PSD1 and planctomycete cytochrome C domain-containing protein [Calycomorphotria hydatis]QDT66715.1 Planctomycete cytochrome C [Calycomorphotria hydatis]